MTKKMSEIERDERRSQQDMINVQIFKHKLAKVVGVAMIIRRQGNNVNQYK